jgi:hypothetical protein
MNVLRVELYCPHKRKRNRTLCFGSTLLKHGIYFDYRNQPLYMSKSVCYLKCREAGLCCYLVIHRKSITVDLLLFVTYMLTLPHISSSYRSAIL